MLRFIPILFVIIIVVSLDKVSSNGHTDLTLNHKYFPLGVIGCMVGEGLCGAKESCIDDNLFGICSEKGLPLQVPNYDLTDPQRIGLLESKILKLLIEGYTWQDAYTQCIVQNLLVASAATTLDAALPLDCSGGGGGGADEIISPSLLSRWSLLNDDKDSDVAEYRDIMDGRNDIISDSGVSAAAIIGAGGSSHNDGGGGGESISDGDDGDSDDDDDDNEEEERQEDVGDGVGVGGGGGDNGGSLDYNNDVYDSVPMSPVQQQHPSFLKSSKRDEIVRIHKYFDQPAVPSRRSSEPPLSQEEALAERYGLMPNNELIDNIPAAERNQVLEQVLKDAGALDSDVGDNSNDAVDDDDTVVDREALRLMNEISASADPKLDDQSNENIINADINADTHTALDLRPLTYVPPDSSSLDSNIIVAGGDQNAYNNYNSDNGGDDDDDDDDGNTDRNDRSLKRSVAEDLADFDGPEQNQLLPQYLLNLQNLLSQQIGSESQRESERKRRIKMQVNNPDENLVRNSGLQDDQMTNKMIWDYPLPDYSLLSDLANEYRGMDDKGHIQQDDGLGSNSMKPSTKGLWGEDFKQVPETDYDYDYPTETAASDLRFPVFKSSLKSDDSLSNMDRTMNSDKLDLSNADSDALKTLLKDILMKAVDVPPSQSQSVGPSLSDSGSNDGKFMSNDLKDIDLSQLKQAEELLRKTGQLNSKKLLNLKKGDRHPKFTLLQRVGEPVKKKAVLMANDNDETATVSEEKPGQATDPQKHYDQVDANYAFVGISNGNVEKEQALKLVRKLEEIMKLPSGTFSGIRLKNGQVTFRISPDVDGITASTVAKEVENHREELEAITGLQLSTAGIGNEVKVVQTTGKSPKYYTLTFVLCGCIATAILAVVAFYMFRQHHQSRQKLAQLSNPDTAEASKDYQDLCRQKMQSKSSEKPEPLHAAATRIASVSEAQVRSPSSRSSTSSWSEEPVSSNMDISTGHIVLSYMEDHLQNRDRLDQEWEALCAYEADPCCTDVAMDTSNARKNRYSDVLPYNHSRVLLNQSTNASGSDYINASTITDHDPKNPAYIATQGPLPHTVADFWQMVWEQGSVVIVMLTKLTENADAMCHRYWPEEGSDLYHIYEVHLVSEHIWCDDYLVRSFYLKNLQTNETRTVTQFHFLSWLDLSIPTSVKVLLDFRRKVNKSFRGRSCPIVVHCNDGCGRTGTYILMDMVLNRMAKGAKEIDIAATLEHIRDQRMKMVRVKEQFQYSLALVAEEVHAILKALPQ